MATERSCEACRHYTFAMLWRVGNLVHYDAGVCQFAKEKLSDSARRSKKHCGPDGRYWEPKESEADNAS